MQIGLSSMQQMRNDIGTAQIALRKI